MSLIPRVAPGRMGCPRCTARPTMIGARMRAQLTESLDAIDVRLSTEELTRIEEAIPTSAVVGMRCDGHQMQALDGEKN